MEKIIYSKKNRTLRVKNEKGEMCIYPVEPAKVKMIKQQIKVGSLPDYAKSMEFEARYSKLLNESVLK